jgi:hypothetical protein
MVQKISWIANTVHTQAKLNVQNETIKTTISCSKVGEWEITFNKLALPSAEEKK